MQYPSIIWIPRLFSSLTFLCCSRGFGSSHDVTFWGGVSTFTVIVFSPRYPVKESLLSTADGASNYLHPWQQKLPTDSHLPTFRM